LARIWKLQIYLSLLFGAGFFALVVVTLRATWILGLALLMPGAYVVRTLPHPMLPALESAIFALVNVLIYAAVALFFLWILGITRWFDRPRRLFFTAALFTLCIVGSGWYGAKRFEESGNGLCRNDVVESLPSPDGRFKVVIFVRNCGATTDYSTHVLILSSQEQVTHADTGNVFVADSNHGGVGTSFVGALDVRARWSNSNSLVISHPQGSRIYLKEGSFKHIGITYTFTTPSDLASRQMRLVG
jgi:hypothetical protein